MWSGARLLAVFGLVAGSRALGDRRSHYEVLGVSKDATEPEVLARIADFCIHSTMACRAQTT